MGTHNFDAQKVREGRGERGEGRGERGEGEGRGDRGENIGWTDG